MTAPGVGTEGKMERIAEIQARCEAATAAPWVVEELDGYITGHVTAKVHDYCGNSGRAARRDSVTHSDSMIQRDADFIAHAREDVPWLLDEIARLAESVEIGLQLSGSFFEALKALSLPAINVANPGVHVTDLIDDLEVELALERTARRAAEKDTRSIILATKAIGIVWHEDEDGAEVPTNPVASALAGVRAVLGEIADILRCPTNADLAILSAYAAACRGLAALAPPEPAG
jgi:hypothetical protein